jgi:hypothetical protein
LQSVATCSAAIEDIPSHNTALHLSIALFEIAPLGNSY